MYGYFGKEGRIKMWLWTSVCVCLCADIHRPICVCVYLRVAHMSLCHFMYLQHAYVRKCVPVSGMNLHQCICEGKCVCVCVCVCVLGVHDKFFSIQSWEMPNISPAKGRKGFHRTALARARPHQVPPALTGPAPASPAPSLQPRPRSQGLTRS